MIEAIPTFYNGRWHRSRTEAYWSVFFDTAQVKTDFEMQGWNVGGLKYLPDFYLPDVETEQEKGCFGEVKWQYPTPLEVTKLRSICDPLGCAGLVLIGRPHPDGQLLWLTTGQGRVHRQSYLSEMFGNVDKAFFAAQSARFEHGENGSELYKRIEARHSAEVEQVSEGYLTAFVKCLLDEVYFWGAQGKREVSLDWLIVRTCSLWEYWRALAAPTEDSPFTGKTLYEFAELTDYISPDVYAGELEYGRLSTIDEKAARLYQVGADVAKRLGAA